MWHNIALICIFMLSEWFVPAFPRFWRQGQTSSFVSHFIFWTWKEIFRVSSVCFMFHFFLGFSLLMILCTCLFRSPFFISQKCVFFIGDCQAPKIISMQRWNHLELISLQSLRCIRWHHRGEDGKHGAASTRWSSAKNTTESREGREMIFCATGSNKKPCWTHKCRNQRQVNVKEVDLL